MRMNTASGGSLSKDLHTPPPGLEGYILLRGWRTTAVGRSVVTDVFTTVIQLYIGRSGFRRRSC